MMQARKVFLFGITVMVILCGVSASHQQGWAAEAVKYPERDIAIIVPFNPGGGCDVIARVSAPYLRKYLPKPVNFVVQNVGAAGGRIGSFQLYDAKPDGYTIGVLEPLIFVVAEAMGQMGKRDITHITWYQRASSQPYVMAVNPKSPIQKIEDLKGKRVRAAVSQSGLAGNVAILRYLGADPQVVMYAGGAECCLAAMRDDVDLVIQVAGTLLRQAEASGGRLVPKCVFTENRLSVAPDLPTVKELGVNVPENLMPLLAFDYVFAAPYGLSKDVYTLLNEAIEKTLADQSFAEQLSKAKLPVAMLSPEEMQKRIAGLPKVVPQYLEAIRQAMGK